MRVYHGYDPREALGSWVWQHSILRRATGTVQFVNLDKRSLQSAYPALFEAGGTNQFIFSRFAVASLADYAGPPVLFADGADMICRADIYRILDEWQVGKAVQVVKRPDYVPTALKYRGTLMEAYNRAYPRKQWSSVMLISPSHAGWRRIKWQITDPAYWQEFGWLKDNEIGELDPAWNRVVDEGDPVEEARILHWSLGVPAMYWHRQAPGAELWWAEAREALDICDPVWRAQLEGVKTAYA